MMDSVMFLNNVMDSTLNFLDKIAFRNTGESEKEPSISESKVLVRLTYIASVP